MYAGTTPERVAHPVGKSHGAGEGKAGSELSEGKHDGSFEI